MTGMCFDGGFTASGYEARPLLVGLGVDSKTRDPSAFFKLEVLTQAGFWAVVDLTMSYQGARSLYDMLGAVVHAKESQNPGVN